MGRHAAILSRAAPAPASSVLTAALTWELYISQPHPDGGIEKYVLLSRLDWCWEFQTDIGP